MADDSTNLLPSPPFVAISGLANFRDIGGYPVVSCTSAGGDDNVDGSKTTTTKKVVRRGVVYRASEPSKVTDDGVSKLQKLGIEKVFDLRSAVEIEKGVKEGYGWQVKEWEGATRLYAPVFLDQDYSPEALAMRYRNYSSETSQVRISYSIHTYLHTYLPSYLSIYVLSITSGGLTDAWAGELAT